MAKATETDRVETLEAAMSKLIDQQAKQGDVLRDLVAKMLEVQASTVAALASVGSSVKGKSPKQLREEFSAKIDDRLAKLERALFDGGPIKFSVRIPIEKQMTRIVGAIDAVHAIDAYKKHFGILRTTEGNDPEAIVIDDPAEAEQKYVDTCIAMRINPLTAAAK